MATSSEGFRRIRWAMLALVVALAYGVSGYMLLQGWPFLDALYMTVTTFTTVGFREVRPLDDAGRVFTLSVIAIGVALVLITIALAAQWVIEGQWGERARRRRMQRRIDGLSDHYLICAYGRVGRAIAREFEAEGVSFVVIDPKEDLQERMDQDAVPYLIEDPSEEEVLLRAGVRRARGLVCAVDSDATNVYITLMARSLNPDLFIVARASERGSDARLLKAGADRVVSPFVSSGRHMALVALHPRAADVVEVESGGATSLRLEELRIEAGSQTAGRSIAEAIGSTPVLAIRHPGGQITANPPQDHVLQQGDLVLMIGEEDLPAVRRDS
ncbi:MAG TPA: NAD-binding protein [Actinomycetota bacterium]|nr:NAD-binding protein [Actinomycetota bacterium]